MEKKYRIIKNEKFDELGQIESVNYFIRELTFKFWKFEIWTEVTDKRFPNTSVLYFKTSLEATEFVEDILKKNVYRDQYVETIINEI